MPPVILTATEDLSVKERPCSASKTSAFAELEKIVALKTTIPSININVKNSAKYVRLFIKPIIHERFDFINYFFMNF